MSLRRQITIDVRYPLERGRLTLRTDSDWEEDVEPSVDGAGETGATFHLTLKKPFAYFKPVLWVDGEMYWSKGDNYLVLAGATRPAKIYPFFRSDEVCSVCSLRELGGVALGTDNEKYQYRIFYPPGYHENTLRHYPVLYMQDGQNLFFPDEAFQGHHWRIAETLQILNSMNALEQVMVVGVYPRNRMRDYTSPGYGAYGRLLVERLKPAVDREYRTLTDPEDTAVMGSSLGGVVSFYLAWEYPEVFGMAACMSSTFGWNDDLRQRVASEPKRGVRFYLDSGWPRDNYEVTRDMRALLIRRGFREGDDLHYYAFPEALHNEKAWALRVHLPLQSFFGKRPVVAADAGGEAGSGDAEATIETPTSEHFLG